MPELPEVEVVRRELGSLRGATVVRVVSNDDRIFVRQDGTDLGTDLAGRVIRDVGRRGKWLRFTLDKGFVFSHLGMTGDWTLRAPGDDPLAFERLRMDVRRRRAIMSARYTDPRRFGRFIVASEDIDAWRALGPDPWLDGIDEPRLLVELGKRKRPIKAVLLDQSLLAGVGNIIAIEALWRARIDPRTPAAAMNGRDVRAIARGLRLVIERTIRYDEAMIEGRRARPPFRIYGRAGAPCARCGDTVRQMVIAGRGTVFCPRCQGRHAPAGG
jgi:formamidopyrimidine-DNA glycosylase